MHHFADQAGEAKDEAHREAEIAFEMAAAAEKRALEAE